MTPDVQFRLGFFAAGYIALSLWIWFDTRPKLEEDAE